MAPGVGEFADAEPVELRYFAIRALGQLQQLILEVAGYPYHYTVTTSPYFREHVKSTLAFGRLPFLRTPDGTQLVQSKAIVRYAAKLCGLAGRSDSQAARCDMLHEVLETEAKVDAGTIANLESDAARAMVAEVGDMKSMGRVEFSDLPAIKKAVATLKFWDEMLSRSKSGWLLGGLEDGGPTDLCYVDLSLYWSLRPHTSKIEACGFASIGKFLRKVGSLPGITRLFESGRLMPNMGEGYIYVGDDLVPEPTV